MLRSKEEDATGTGHSKCCDACVRTRFEFYVICVLKINLPELLLSYKKPELMVWIRMPVTYGLTQNPITHNNEGFLKFYSRIR